MPIVSILWNTSQSQRPRGLKSFLILNQAAGEKFDGLSDAHTKSPALAGR